jgi:hypothetical protein
MAKESGLGFAVAVDDSGSTARDVSNDVISLSFSTPRNVQEVTGVDMSGVERLLLLADMSFTPAGVFNDAANMSHAVFSTVPSSSVPRLTTLSISGQILDNSGTDGGVNLLYSDYALNRSDAGEFTWTAPGALADGLVPTWGTV